MSSTAPNITATLRSVADEYPSERRKGAHNHVPRMAFHLEEIVKRKGTDIAVCDLGGGTGPFSPGCAALGMQSILVDDFGDEINERLGDAVFAVHRNYGVDIQNRDVVADPPIFPANSLDVVTTFDSMEHWHRSPKRLFTAVMDWLKPGGMFFVGVPNNVNLRKRIMVPLGHGEWSLLKDWYEPETFRGHVREPSVKDLKWIASDMGLTDIEILGRNWQGYISRFAPVKLLTPFFDKALWSFPTLCSDIYLIARKPE